MDEQPKLAVIGGSGLYQMPDLQNSQTHDLDTPFGKPSAPIIVGILDGVPVAFLARHGDGHRISPSEINYRANIYALKSIGVEQIVSITACGSLREDYAPGNIVIPDQLFDFTKDRNRTFFEGGLVAHISVADPFCKSWSDRIYEAVAATGAPVHQGGSFITIEGPRFSTRSESNIFRSWGISIIGMTTSPEAFLAREAEICYAAMAHVTDYDVWHVSEDPVTAKMVFRIVNQNLEIAQGALRNLVTSPEDREACDCADTLATALSTNPAAIDSQARKRLAVLVDKYLDH